ncbi:nattectin-like protein [Aphelenchoides avenae]|nr:nattectin-like protein [Aphelenchus avenae]
MFPNHVWNDANDFCYLLFGNLPIVPNAFANNAVLGLALNYTMTPWVPYTAIGLHDPGKNGTWVWTDGQKFTYSNWEKKPRPGDGHCTFMCTNASECRVGTWKAMPCDDQKKADMNQLCQRRPYMR